MDKPYSNYLKKKGLVHSTIVSYEQRVALFTQWTESHNIDHEQVTYNDLLNYLSHLRSRKLGAATIQSYMAAITHYFEALTQAEAIDRNPASYLELKTRAQRKLYPTLSKAQLEKLYTGFDTKAFRKTKPTARLSALRNKIATGLMVFQGLDVKVLGNLKTEDTDVLGGTVNIRGSRKHNARTLALEARQIIELDRYINQVRKQLQHAFKKEDSELLLITGYSHYTDAHRKLMQRLKKQEPQLQNVQQIRASVITHWLKQYNLREVQYMAGHKSVQSTEKYLQNDTESLQLDIDRFHPSVHEAL